MKERNYGIDFVKVLAVIFVILHHTVDWGFTMVDNASVGLRTIWYATHSLSLTCVDLFAITTGYLCVTSNNTLKRLTNLWLQVFFIGVLITGIGSLMGLDVGAYDWLQASFPVMTGEYWYFTAYTGLFFVKPLLDRAVAACSETTARKVFLTIFLVFVLVFLINRTKIGMAMRAVSKDFETSQLMGIKINSVISITFVIGSFLAGVGSILYFTNYTTVIQTSGAMPGLKAFVAAVFGGIGSIPGAVVGAFIIGIMENIIKGLDVILFKAGLIAKPLGLATFSDAFTFALLIIILIVKPTGLFGEKTTDKV